MYLSDRSSGLWGPHYRAVVGDDDAVDVTNVDGPWCPESKRDIDDGGPCAPIQNVRGDKAHACHETTSVDRLAVWHSPDDGRGLPGHAHRAALTAPWEAKVTAPAAVGRGATPCVAVRVVCPCPAPFAAGELPSTSSDARRAAVAPPGGPVTAGGAGNATVRVR